MTNRTLDLFADEPGTAGSLIEYQEAFAEWLADTSSLAQMRESSTEVYEHMWSAWTAWAVAQGLRIGRITATDLDAYLLSRGGADDLSPRYAWRLLRLVDRVLASHVSTRDLAPNRAADLMAARPEIRYANSHDADPLPEYLPAAEARRLVAFLSAVRPGRKDTARPWQEVRDRASVAVMLGAGLTPGEVRALKVADAVIEGGRSRDVPWKLHVDGNGNAPARETPLASWAGQLLRHWLQVRAEQGIPGPVMFPSTRSTGKRWSKMSQYLATKQVLIDANIERAEGGSFRLRHTFALRQLRRGKSPDDVARWLGVTDPDVMARYGRVISAPIDVV
jgi:integrase